MQLCDKLRQEERDRKAAQEEAQASTSELSTLRVRVKQLQETVTKRGQQVKCVGTPLCGSTPRWR